MLSAKRVVAAALVGLAGCLFIWIAAPYNNFLLNNSFISDTFFPVAGVIFMLVLVLGVNSALRSLGRQWTLNGRQLALIFVMLLAAAVVPSQGLMRMLPWTLARATQDINLSERLSEAVDKAGIRHSLFPEPIGYELDTPVSNQLLDELEEGDSIPWGSWLPLVPVWGSFLLVCWMLMVGMGLILFPEWKDRERLPFPLLNVYRSILPDSDSGTILPSVFKNRLFWAGAGTVMFLYALKGLDHHLEGGFPSFPMGWRLSSIFTETPWRYMHSTIKNVDHIYFILVGMAFFMPNRVGFSIWSTTLIYGVYEMLRRAYFPASYGGVVHDHRNGAMIAIAFGALYLSRHHWVYVAKLMFSRAKDNAEKLLKVGGWMLTAGAVGMFAWLRWAGVPHLWAVFFVFIGFMVTLLVSRIVAETGMPFVRITGINPSYFMTMLPAGWLTGTAIYMAGFVSMVFQLGSRVSAAVMVSHGVGLDEKGGPRQQLRIGLLMLIILMVGFVVCGAVHLKMGYSHATSLDGQATPLCPWGSQRMNEANNQLLRWTSEAWPDPNYNRIGQLLVGISIAAAIQMACLYIPKWPLHPIGLLLVGHFYSQMAWASILIGWMLKTLILHYGGGGMFKRAKPLFLGLIMGEIFAAVIWTLVPVALILLGHDPTDVGHIQLLPR